MEVQYSEMHAPGTRSNKDLPKCQSKSRFLSASGETTGLQSDIRGFEPRQATHDQPPLSHVRSITPSSASSSLTTSLTTTSIGRRSNAPDNAGQGITHDLNQSTVIVIGGFVATVLACIAARLAVIKLLLPCLKRRRDPYQARYHCIICLPIKSLGRVNQAFTITMALLHSITTRIEMRRLAHRREGRL